jgi:hypothetical protein
MTVLARAGQACLTVLHLGERRGSRNLIFGIPRLPNLVNQAKFPVGTRVGELGCSFRKAGSAGWLAWGLFLGVFCSAMMGILTMGLAHSVSQLVNVGLRRVARNSPRRLSTRRLFRGPSPNERC